VRQIFFIFAGKVTKTIPLGLVKDKAQGKVNIEKFSCQVLGVRTGKKTKGLLYLPKILQHVAIKCIVCWKCGTWFTLVTFITHQHLCEEADKSCVSRSVDLNNLLETNWSFCQL